MQLLLRRGGQTSITEGVVKSAVHRDKIVLRLLLSQVGQISVTEG